VHATRQAVAHASAGGGYVHFIADDETPDRVRAAYGGNYARLTSVKAAYDPDNFFRLNYNIPPPVDRHTAEATAVPRYTSQRSGPPRAGA
jgi:hypothetical protein